MRHQKTGFVLAGLPLVVEGLEEGVGVSVSREVFWLLLVVQYRSRVLGGIVRW